MSQVAGSNPALINFSLKSNFKCTCNVHYMDANQTALKRENSQYEVNKVFTLQKQAGSRKKRCLPKIVQKGQRQGFKKKTWKSMNHPEILFHLMFFIVMLNIYKKSCVRQLSSGTWVIPPGWGTICDGVNYYVRKCTIYYPWLQVHSHSCSSN